MRITSLVKVDSKGRVTIPMFVREALEIHEGRHLIAIADIDKKEIILTPLSSTAENIYEIRVEMQDKPGALVEISKILKELGLDQLITRCSTLKRGEIGECTFITEPIEGKEVDIEDIKKRLEESNIVFFASVKKLERA